MRLAFEQLSSHLEREFRPLYVLTGDEPLALTEGVDAIRQAAKKRGVEERLSYTAERGFNWQQLLASGQAASLFSSLRLIEIHLPSGKPGTEGAKALQTWCSAPAPDTFTLITLPKLDGQTQKSAWYGALEASAVIVPLMPVTIDQLPQWIERRLKAQGQTADVATLEFIATQVEGNLLAAHQEIRKLGLLLPQGSLQAATVREAVLNVSRYDVFQLGDAMLNGDLIRTGRILQGLKSEGMQPVALLGVLGWLLRGVARVKLAESRGDNVMQAMQQARIYGERQQAVRRMLGRINARHMEAAIAKMAEIDKFAKGLGHGDAWLEISRLCVGLARLGARSKPAT